MLEVLLPHDVFRLKISLDSSYVAFIVQSQLFARR